MHFHRNKTKKELNDYFLLANSKGRRKMTLSREINPLFCFWNMLPVMNDL